MMLFLVVTCLLACPVLPMELRGNEDGFGRGTSLARARLGAGWRERPFAAFSAQCSHNTYTTGRQSGCPLRPMLTAHGTDPAAMKTALRLGYRCIEIDVHPRRPSLMGVADEAWVPEAAKPAEPSLIKVVHREHHSGYTMTNSAQLNLFVKAIVEWMEKDEEAPSAAGHHYRMPVIISVENRVLGMTKLEAQMARELNWLDTSSTGANVKRIVRASELRDIQGELKMRYFVAESAKGEPRRIIIKSSVDAKHSPSAWMDIVSMPKKSKDLLQSTSISEGHDKLGQVENALKNGDLVRIYPKATEFYSGNYKNLAQYFQKGAQMVCVNLQGHTDAITGHCLDPKRGSKTETIDGGQECTGNREVAAALEAAFIKYGFDGYVSLSPEPPQAFLDAVDEDVPVDPNTSDEERHRPLKRSGPAQRNILLPQSMFGDEDEPDGVRMSLEDVEALMSREKYEDMTMLEAGRKKRDHEGHEERMERERMEAAARSVLEGDDDDLDLDDDF